MLLSYTCGAPPSVSLDTNAFAFVKGLRFYVCPMQCSRDLQVRISANSSLKLGSTALFTHLKIILLQCFQFSAINGIQTDPNFSLLV